MNLTNPTRATDRWLESVAAWTLFVTPTHRHAVTLDEAAAILQRWAQALARELGEHLHLAWAVEEGGMFRRAHSHALIAPWRCPFPIDAAILERLWREANSSAGDIEVKPYVRGRGAAGYIMKADRFGYGVLCPRLNECRRRCLAGRSPFSR